MIDEVQQITDRINTLIEDRKNIISRRQEESKKLNKTKATMFMHNLPEYVRTAGPKEDAIYMRISVKYYDETEMQVIAEGLTIVKTKNRFQVRQDDHFSMLSFFFETDGTSNTYNTYNRDFVPSSEEEFNSIAEELKKVISATNK